VGWTARIERIIRINPSAEDVMRKPLAIIAALLLAAAVLGVLAAAPLSLYYS
jgi:hypothetical protein